VVQPVGSAVIAAFCEDGDGCTVRMRMSGASGFRVGERVLFKVGTSWTTTDLTSGVDADGIQADALYFGTGNGNYCAFTDLDSILFDDVAGFSVIAYFDGGAGATAGFTCLLTLID
jgi:hypothetical protein